jgi:hypothetical protein
MGWFGRLKMILLSLGIIRKMGYWVYVCFEFLTLVPLPDPEPPYKYKIKYKKSKQPHS